LNNHSWEIPRTRAHTQGMHNVDSIVSLEAKLEALTKKIEKLNVVNPQTQVMFCDFYGIATLIISAKAWTP
jgi:hypothetical protein